MKSKNMIIFAGIGVLAYILLSGGQAQNQISGSGGGSGISGWNITPSGSFGLGGLGGTSSNSEMIPEQALFLKPSSQELFKKATAEQNPMKKQKVTTASDIQQTFAPIVNWNKYGIWGGLK